MSYRRKDGSKLYKITETLTWLTIPHVLWTRRIARALLEVGLQRAVVVGAAAGVHASSAT